MYYIEKAMSRVKPDLFRHSWTSIDWQEYKNPLMHVEVKRQKMAELKDYMTRP